MTEAEQVATGIFRKAGVETEWADIVLTAKNGQVNSADHSGYTLADIQLNIFPDDMSDRSGLSNNVMGFAPGSGPDRRIVYIFYGNVEARFRRTLRQQGSARPYLLVSMAKILGHAIAHEVGHLLLSQQVHSAHGIMRGEWGFLDFRDMRCGMLLFTPQQAEFLRADVRSRNTRQDIDKVAAIESPALAP